MTAQSESIGLENINNSTIRLDPREENESDPISITNSARKNKQTWIGKWTSSS